MNLTELSNKAHTYATKQGFHPKGQSEDVFIERMCNLLHTEVSEIYEAYREGKLRMPCDKFVAMQNQGIVGLMCLEEELADIIIRVLDNAKHLGVNIELAVYRKMQFNETRPFRHGGKKS